MLDAREFLLADADVLIDYVASDLAILALASEHIGVVHVLKQTLATVGDLSERDWLFRALRSLIPEQGDHRIRGRRSLIEAVK